MVEVGVTGAFSNYPTDSRMSSFPLTDLDADTSYDISVLAINGAGPGSLSQSTRLTTAFGGQS